MEMESGCHTMTMSPKTSEGTGRRGMRHGEEEGHFSPALKLSLGPSIPLSNLYPSPSLSKRTQGKIQVSKDDYEI